MTVSDQVPQQLEVIDLASTKGDIAVSGQTVTAYPRTLEAGETAEYRITGACARKRPAWPGCEHRPYHDHHNRRYPWQ